MRTRARDYVENPAIPKRKKRVSAKSDYLQAESIPIPNFLKSHPTIKSPTPNRKIDRYDIVQLFDRLSLSDSALSPDSVPTTSNGSHNLTRTTKPLPPLLASTPFKSSPTYTFLNPNFDQHCLPTIPTHIPLTVMRVLGATAPHKVEEWKTVKFKLGLPRLVSNSGDGILKANGSNYTDWEYQVTRLIETTCGRKRYLDDPQAHITNPEGGKVMARIIELLVPVNIACKLSDCTLARQAFLKV